MSTWTQPAPIGTLRVTIGPRGVTGIEFDAAPARDDDEPDGAVSKRLVAYFDGDLTALEPLEVDLGGVGGSRRRVYEELRAVPAGSTVGYGELARMAGLEGPFSPRAVGQAMAANPMPLVVPCHRVIAADGSLGGFGAGLDTKRWLLAHEGVTPRHEPTLFSVDD